MDRTVKIIEIVRSISKKTTVPDRDESLFDSGYLDSFALPDMATELEAQFGIQIPDKDLNPRKFDTISSIDRYIAQAVLSKA